METTETTDPVRLDAVAWVRRVRDAHREALKGASREERIAFFNGKVQRTAPPPRERVD